MNVSPYVDAESLVVDYLSPLLEARLCTEIPADLSEDTVRVERIGGGSPLVALDDPLLDIDCFSATRVSVKALATLVRSLVEFSMLGYSIPGATVAAVSVNAFNWRPYTNTNVRSYGMTASLTLHNHS